MVSSGVAKHIREQYALRLKEWLNRKTLFEVDAHTLRLQVIEYLEDEKHL